MPKKSQLKPLVREAEWLDHADKVSINEYPPLFNETERMVVSKLNDGTQEVSYECEYCKKLFITPAQLTGEGAVTRKARW